jgi:ribosomal protein S18 acetylase RimI-like enzyme
MVERSCAVTVRRGRPADLQAIGALWDELLEFHIRLDDRYKTAPQARETFVRHVSGSVMRSPDHALFVAEAEGRIVGFLIGRVEHGGVIYADPDFGYITDACVHEDYRRLGVGRLLFDAVREWFRGRGLSNIRVSVATDNPVSRSFWMGMGFRPFMERLWYDLDD